MGTRIRLLGLCALAAVLLSAGRAGATTIVPVSDRDLTVSVRAIVEGRVERTEARWDDDRGAVFSFVTVSVDRALKGDVPPGRVVLEQLGGETADRATVVFGAPAFAAGDRVLLFLNTGRDGSLHVAHLSLGVFRVEADGEGGEVVVRPAMGEGVTVLGGASAAARRESRAEFVASILATLAADADEVARYDASRAATPIQLVPPGYAPTASKGDGPMGFTFLGSGYRWFEPDSNRPVTVRVNTRGAQTPSGGVAEAQAAFAAWSSVSGSSLRMQYGGTTNAAGLRADGTTAISFGDPYGEIDDPVNCSGVIARGGVSNANPGDTVTRGGKSFAHIVEGDLVFNNGFECVTGDSIALAEVMTHELGHVLGIGHASESSAEANATLRDATMYYRLHNDGRGASVREDDADAVRALYGRPGGAAAPSIERAAYKTARERLVVSAGGVSGSATVTLNGRSLGAARVGRTAGGVTRLVVTGSASQLGLRGAGQNVVTVASGGSTSAEFAF